MRTTARQHVGYPGLSCGSGQNEGICRVPLLRRRLAAFGLHPTKYPATRWPQLVDVSLCSIGMISDHCHGVVFRAVHHHSCKSNDDAVVCNRPAAFVRISACSDKRLCTARHLSACTAIILRFADLLRRETCSGEPVAVLHRRKADAYHDR